MNRTTFSAVAAPALLALLLVSCSDNPATPPADTHEHEAEGLYLISGSDTVTYRDGIVTGTLSLRRGDTSAPIALLFLDHEGETFVPEGTEHSLGWTIADTTIAGAVPVAGLPWSLRLIGRGVGTTTTTLRLLHGGHDDFVSRPVTIVVTE